MKKICFVTTIFLTYKCFLAKLSEYLNASGEYDISLICADEDGVRESLPDYVHYFPVAMKRGVSLSGFSAIREMKEIFQREKFDIVQYSTPNAAFYASIASKKAKIPVRLYCQWGIRYMGFTGWKRAVFKKIERIICKDSTFIEAESHNIRDFSIAEGLYPAEKSCVIWNGSACGVDLTKFDIGSKAAWRAEVRNALQLSDNTVVFAFAARLTADKGINELLEAFLQLEKTADNVALLVMGGMDDSGSLDPVLMQQAQASSRVIMTGSVADIERYYAASDVFVAPSYREGFGLVVVEAEAMGLPAIVSDVPGQIDAIRLNETGLRCTVKDAHSLLQAMQALLSDAALRQTLGTQAAAFARDSFEQNELFARLQQHRDEMTSKPVAASHN